MEPGRSKHQDKLQERQQGLKQGSITGNYIYSYSTLNGYMKHANYFADYCKREHGCKTLEQCRSHVDEWLATRTELSAYTQKLEASALAKLYGCSTNDFAQTAVRHRADIIRSRGECTRDRHFSEERHRDFVEFCRSTGLRREELRSLTGDKLIERDGKYYMKVDAGAKGGRYREAPVIGNVEHVRNIMERAGSGKVWEKLPNGADIHSYRSHYATQIYKEHARPIDEIKNIPWTAPNGRTYQSSVYYCRAELKGTAYDREAMLEASKALGHNRISVVAEHYIREE